MILLNIAIQLFQQHLLVRLSFVITFFICYFWWLCWKWIIYIWISLFLGSLYHCTELCVCFYANIILTWLWPVANSLNLRSMIALALFSFKIVLAIFFFMIPYEFRIFFISVKNYHWHFYKDCTKSLCSFGYNGPFHNLFIYFYLIPLISLVLHCFQYTYTSPSCLNLLISILFFVMIL